MGLDPDSTYFIMSVWPVKNPCRTAGMSKSKFKLVSDSFFFHHFNHDANVLPIWRLCLFYCWISDYVIHFSPVTKMYCRYCQLRLRSFWYWNFRLYIPLLSRDANVLPLWNFVNFFIGIIRMNYVLNRESYKNGNSNSFSFFFLLLFLL